MKTAIAIRGLRYIYPDGTEALRGVDLSVSEGERVALIGPNGAGKTTLLLHLNGLIRGEGEIEILGVPLGKGTLPQIRRRVGLLFQDPDSQLFMARVFDDVAFGPINLGLPEREVRARVAEALRLVGMEGFADREPHRLSTGEKKKIALAAVLSMHPEILALDEPTSNLDPRGRREILGIIRELEATVIVATHDLEFVIELCERAVLMDAGKVVADGPVREVLSNPELMYAHGLEVPPSLRDVAHPT
jgi:cobalt/nickel transport system ATP-binding protein